MAPPTTLFKTFARTTAASAVATATDRRTLAGSSTTIGTSGSNQLDFGTIDISGGAADSLVFYAIWYVTVNGGNTTVEDFRLWHSSNGFDLTGSGVNAQPMSGSDKSTPVNTKNYVQNAVVSTYVTWAQLPLAETLPGAQNMYAGNEATSIDITTVGASTDISFWAMYITVADNETTGTYDGTTTDYEMQFSFRYTYS